MRTGWVGATFLFPHFVASISRDKRTYPPFLPMMLFCSGPTLHSSSPRCRRVLSFLRPSVSRPTESAAQITRTPLLAIPLLKNPPNKACFREEESVLLPSSLSLFDLRPLNGRPPIRYKHCVLLAAKVVGPELLMLGSSPYFPPLTILSSMCALPNDLSFIVRLGEFLPRVLPRVLLAGENKLCHPMHLHLPPPWPPSLTSASDVRDTDLLSFHLFLLIT